MDVGDRHQAGRFLALDRWAPTRYLNGKIIYVNGGSHLV
jgi:hypothetical protein